MGTICWICYLICQLTSLFLISEWVSRNMHQDELCKAVLGDVELFLLLLFARPLAKTSFMFSISCV